MMRSRDTFATMEADAMEMLSASPRTMVSWGIARSIRFRPSMRR